MSVFRYYTGFAFGIKSKSCIICWVCGVTLHIYIYIRVSTTSAPVWHFQLFLSHGWRLERRERENVWSNHWIQNRKLYEEKRSPFSLISYLSFCLGEINVCRKLSRPEVWRCPIRRHTHILKSTTKCMPKPLLYYLVVMVTMRWWRKEKERVWKVLSESNWK